MEKSVRSVSFFREQRVASAKSRLSYFRHKTTGNGRYYNRRNRVLPSVTLLQHFVLYFCNISVILQNMKISCKKIAPLILYGCKVILKLESKLSRNGRNGRNGRNRRNGRNGSRTSGMGVGKAKGTKGTKGTGGGEEDGKRKCTFVV